MDILGTIRFYTDVNDLGIPTDSPKAIYILSYLKMNNLRYRIVPFGEAPKEGCRLVLDGIKLTLDEAFDRLFGGVLVEDQALTDFERAVNHYFNNRDDKAPISEGHYAYNALMVLAYDVGMTNYLANRISPSIADVRLFGASLSTVFLLADTPLFTTCRSFYNVYALAYLFSASLYRVDQILFISMGRDYEVVEQFIQAGRPLEGAVSALGTIVKVELNNNNDLNLPAGEYIIKHYENNGNNDQKKEGYFLSELDVLFHLRYPNIVKLFAYVYTKPHKCLILEFIDGGTVEDHFPEFDLLRTILVAERMAMPLHFVHTHFGITWIHGDLKLQNFCLRGVDDAVLIDFGFSGNIKVSMPTAFSEFPLKNELPPMLEPNMQDPPADWKSDVYAFGMCIIRLITGMVIVYDKERSMQDKISEIYPRGGDVRKLLREDLRDIEGVELKVAEEFVELALQCISIEERETRPPIYKIVDELHKLGQRLTPQAEVP